MQNLLIYRNYRQITVYWVILLFMAFSCDLGDFLWTVTFMILELCHQIQKREVTKKQALLEYKVEQFFFLHWCLSGATE